MGKVQVSFQSLGTLQQDVAVVKFFCGTSQGSAKAGVVKGLQGCSNKWQWRAW